MANRNRFYLAMLIGSGLTVLSYGAYFWTRSEAIYLGARGLLGISLILGGLALKRFVETEPIHGVPACQKK